MRRLVIGSVAMRELIPGSREPRDLDVFSDTPEPSAEVFWHPEFDTWLTLDMDRSATLDELYTIKVSHSAWVIGDSWEKHITDAMILRDHGAVIDQGLHDLLYRVWETKHGRKKVDLAMDKTRFFDDAVPRVYDHDSIHASVAYGDRPLYESVMKDGESVATDMRKVKALPLADQIRLYREEIFATALERWVIPSEYTISPGLAYKRAVKKTITSLTKAWSSQFLIENYGAIRRPDTDYVARHLNNSHKLIRLEQL